VYYSDEYAVLDADGRVHPYARPLSLRDPDGRARRMSAHALGARSASGAAAVGLIALTEYRPGSRLAPVALTPAAAALHLLRHAVPARTRPQQTMAHARAAVAAAVAWRSARDEADEAAALIAHGMARSAERTC